MIASNMSTLDLKLASVAENIKVWQARSYSACHHISTDATKFQTIHWNYDSQKVVCVPANSHHATLVTFTSGSPQIENIQFQRELTCARFSNTSSTFAAGSQNGSIVIWDTKQKGIVNTLLTSDREITCLQFNWNDANLISGSANGVLSLHDCTTGQNNARIGSSIGSSVQSVSYCYFHNHLVGAAYYSGTVALWDVNTRQKKCTFTDAHTAPATGIRFSYINPLLVVTVGLDKKVCCYDMKSKAVAKTFSCDFPITCFDFKEDGHMVAVGSIHGEVLVYDLRYLTCPVNIISAHKTAVNCLSFQSRSRSAAVREKVPKNIDLLRSQAFLVDKSSTGNDPVYYPSVDYCDFDFSVSKTGESCIFDVFSPVEEISEPFGFNDFSNVFSEAQKPSMIHKNSLKLFSPLEQSPSRSGITCRSADGSPILSERPTFFSRISQSRVMKTTAVDFHKQMQSNEMMKKSSLSPLSSNDYGMPPKVCQKNDWPPEKPDSERHCIPDISCLNLRGMCSANAGKINRKDIPSTRESSRFYGTQDSPSGHDKPVTATPRSISFEGKLSPIYSIPEKSDKQYLFCRSNESMDEGRGTCTDNTPMTPEAFQMEYIRQCVCDAMEEQMDEYRKLFHQQHVQMCKEMERQREFIESLFVKYSIDSDLVAQANRLRKQNYILKNLYH